MNKDTKATYVPLDEEIVDGPTVAPVKAAPSPPSSNAWIYCGLFAGLFFGLANFFIGEVSGKAIHARLIGGVGNGFGGVIYFCIRRIFPKPPLKPGEGSFDYLYYENGKFKKILIVFLLMDMIIAAFGVFAIIYTFQLALYADMNMGIIPIIFSFASIFASVIAFFLLGEKTQGHHWLGMVLLILCGALISLSGQRDESSVVVVEGQVAEKISKVILIVFGLLCPVYMASRTIYIKYFRVHYQVNPTDLVSLSAILASVVYLVLCFVVIYPEGETFEFVLYGLIGSVCQVFGTFFVYYATSMGLAGPAAAIASIQVVLQVILEVVVHAQVPLLLEFIGGAIGIIGAVFIASGDKIYKSVFAKKEEDKVE